MKSPIAGLGDDGPYQPTWEALLQDEAPAWYRDAKLGIWAHWSSQCVPGKIQNVQLLGTDQKVQWKQYPAGLRIQLPSEYRAKNDHTAALKISLV